MENHAEDTMEGQVGPGRKLMPDTREGITHKVEIGGFEGYITANVNADKELGELFIKGFGKEGSTLQAWMDAFAIMFSIALQFGSEFEMIARKFAHMKFEPNGPTNNPEIPTCWSVPDYIFKWLTLRFGDEKLLHEMRQIDEEMSR